MWVPRRADGKTSLGFAPAEQAAFFRFSVEAPLPLSPGSWHRNAGMRAAPGAGIRSTFPCLPTCVRTWGIMKSLPPFLPPLRHGLLPALAELVPLQKLDGDTL
ncbi:MAG: hypothetical protein CMN05_14955 [Roseibacillus sp.]|nr:hypothetical protein [Roseibacillus sp.]